MQTGRETRSYGGCPARGGLNARTKHYATDVAESAHGKRTTDTSETTPIPTVEDSREMCFQQGKPCIYAAPDDPDVIVTEWPNGTVDHKDPTANTRTRRWPDGTIDTQAADTPATFPHWPRSTA